MRMAVPPLYRRLCGSEGLMHPACRGATELHLGIGAVGVAEPGITGGIVGQLVVRKRHRIIAALAWRMGTTLCPAAGSRYVQ